MNIPTSTVEAGKIEELIKMRLLQQQKANISTIDAIMIPSNNYALSAKLAVSSFCQHTKIIKNKDFDNCFHCGVQKPRVTIYNQRMILK